MPGKSNLDVIRRTLADICDLEKLLGFLMSSSWSLFDDSGYSVLN